MAQSAADRRRIQRQIARELNEKRYQRRTGQAGERAREQAKETRTSYLDRMARSRDFSNLSDAEKKSLASAASNSYYGRGNPDWFDAFKEFFYHDKEG